MNAIPKEGGNTFNWNVTALYANKSLAGNNLSQDYIDQGLTAVNGLKRTWDVNPNGGGPLMDDKLWFYVAYRNNEIDKFVADSYYNSDPLAWVYVPDKTRQGTDEQIHRNYAARLTWQATPRNKFNFSYEKDRRITPHRRAAATVSPEATTYTPFYPNAIWTAVWRVPVNNRLLLDTGFMAYEQDWDERRQINPAVGFDAISVTEDSTGQIYRASTVYGHNFDNPITVRSSAAYVTGTHSYKAGFMMRVRGNGPTYQQHVGQRRHELQLPQRRAAPGDALRHAHRAAQRHQGRPRHLRAGLVGAEPHDDQLRRALRLSERRRPGAAPPRGTVRARAQLRGGEERAELEGHQPAPRRVVRPLRQRSNGRQGDDWPLHLRRQPRVERQPGEHVGQQRDAHVDRREPRLHPRLRLEQPGHSTVNAGRCRTSISARSIPTATQFDKEVLEGWGVRPYNWSVSAGVQRQISGGASVDVSYFRRWYGNFSVVDNQLVGPEDYDPFCITAPSNDPRLPNAGEQVCGFYDIKPAKNGLSQNLVRLAKHYGDQTEIYNGVDASVNWRGRGLTLFAGLSTGRTTTSQCFVVDVPAVYLTPVPLVSPATPTATNAQSPMANCEVVPPFLTQYKGYGVYQLPWGVSVSGTYQAVPQPASAGAFTSITADYVATNAEIRPSLGRDLAAGANGTATLELLKPFALLGGHTKQLDLRIGKLISSSGRTRVRLSLDIYNVFNSNDWQTITTRLSSNAAANRWQRPTLILLARYFQIGTQIDF